MAMLAEPRKKSKYRVHPTGFSKTKKRIDDDTSSFGYKLMASMGWSPGKGLGATETGNIDPVRLRLKNDSAGIGYKVSEKDDALGQQSEFQALLQQLNSGDSSEGHPGDKVPKKPGKSKIKSLEKQSEQSAVRVHYKKFTRSKDLSRASEKDLRSILGLTSLLPNQDQQAEEPEPSVPIDSVVESKSELFISGGSANDYFQKKLGDLKQKGKKDKPEKKFANGCDSLNSDSSDKDKKKTVTWGDVDVSFVDNYIQDMVDTSGSIDETSNDPDFTIGPQKKKKKKKRLLYEYPVPIHSTEEVGNLNIEKKTKKKKRKVSEESSNENVTDVTEENHSVKKKAKKQKLENSELEPPTNYENDFTDGQHSEVVAEHDELSSNHETDVKCNKKRKKKKKNQELSDCVTTSE